MIRNKLNKNEKIDINYTKQMQLDTIDIFARDYCKKMVNIIKSNLNSQLSN